MSHRLKGVPAAPGIAIGKTIWLQDAPLAVPDRPADLPEVERQRLHGASQRVRESTLAFLNDPTRNRQAEQQAIFGTHLIMLDDPDLWEIVEQGLRQDRLPAERAWMAAVDFHASRLESLPDEYLQARAVDVRDIGARVLRQLLGLPDVTLADLPEPVLLLAEDLLPSDTMTLDATKLLGFCTCQGGPLSHAAILSRALGLPAIVGVGDALRAVPGGVLALANGTTGDVIVDPDPATVAEYRRLHDAQAEQERLAHAHAHDSARTVDGIRVEIVANIGSVEDARLALDLGAEGVGLLRTEFLYMNDQQAPSEPVQVEGYRAILEVLAMRPVTIRTLDIGGDKCPAYLSLGREANPFLGWRAIRVCLDQPDFFKVQLRALWRAARGHDVRLMFPMIAVPEEFRRAKALLDEARQELVAEGVDVAERVQVGMMVEIPSAVVLAETFARVVDFFSIGTNDLTQYTFAADRTNAKVSALADSCHPAIFRQIEPVVRAAHANSIWVGVCGELAGDLEAIPVLLGLGVDELSMAPGRIPAAKHTIRRWSMASSQAIARRVLELESSSEARQAVRNAQVASAVEGPITPNSGEDLA